MQIPRKKYPEAKWLGDGGSGADGEGWGPLPDESRGASFDQLRIVLHTTESLGLPDYNNGRDAPHVTFHPRGSTKIYQHNHFDRRVGTLIGISQTGILGNEFSIQAEIICFSDQDLAEKYGGLWVGELTVGDYQMIANWVAWVREELGIPVDWAYGPEKDFEQFLWGKHTKTRMSDSAWLNAGQCLTAHGAAARQDHWDTGVLDVHNILEWSYDGATEPVPPGSKMLIGIDFVAKGDGVKSGDGWRKRVRYWQRILRRVALYDGELDGIYLDKTEEAVSKIAGVEDPSEIGNKNAFLINRYWMRSEAADIASELMKDLEAGLVPHSHPVPNLTTSANQTGPAVAD